MKSVAAVSALAASPLKKIRTLDLIHHSHTDVGFTDMPSVCRELQVRFLDAALEACLRNPSFRWTMEAMLTVDDWWKGASPARRAELLKMVKAGRMDAMALPFNQAPFMDARQWRQAFDWLPASLWKDLNPRVGMQNDVNGFPRAGAVGLLDRGIRRLMMGINVDSGGVPFRRPSAFWWKMPDGRRLFVWLGDHYGTAYAFFEEQRWQQGQPKGGTANLRAPYEGDHLKTDEASLRRMQAHLTKRLAKLEEEGYEHDRLILSYTNQWRYDNDPPFPPLAPFVTAWNKLGLEPALRLTTATDAVMEMEKAVGAVVPTHEGEWTDWWANGDASGPREVAASRVAKRFLSAAWSPVWGAPNDAMKRKTAEMLKDLCLFDEHTWGANISISHPDALDTIAQYTEKSLLAYKPMGHAEWMLGQRARLKFSSGREGTYVVNTAPLAVSGWAKYQGISKPAVWVESIAPHSFVKLDKPLEGTSAKPVVETGPDGWPVAATWPGMAKPLFQGAPGGLIVVSREAPANRGGLKAEQLAHVRAEYGAASRKETPHTLVYTQTFRHKRFGAASREIELWRREPRAQVTVRMERLSSAAPECLYVEFAMPVEGRLPRFSNGGMAFTPYTDQLPGSCRDYYAIDSWAHYDTPRGHWLWVTRDAPLVTVGGPHTLRRVKDAPKDSHRICAMVFDNFWHTNFVANSHGLFEFQFELAWKKEMPDPGALAATLMSEPLIVESPGLAATPELLKSLFTP
jgi:hypothetical protein